MITLHINKVPDKRREEANIMLSIYQAIRDDCPLLDTDIEQMRNFLQKQGFHCIAMHTPVSTNKDSK